LVKLQKDVSFLNKALLMKNLAQIPSESKVIINAQKAQFIDHDIQEVLNDFIATCPDRNISITVEGFKYKIEEKI